jgi:hypothetical protein
MADKDFKVKNGIDVAGNANIDGNLNAAKYQTSAPSSPVTGQLWIDSDASAGVLNQNDYLLKADASASTGYVSKVGGDTVIASGAAVKPLVLKGASSQTANLQEWQDSTGAVVASVSPTGNITGSGLTFINETSFSAVASVSLPDDTFTSDFSNYRVMFQLTAVSTLLGINARFRASGADNTTTNYNYYTQSLNSVSGAIVNTRNRTQNVAIFTNASALSPNISIDVYNPKNAVFTSAYGYGTYTLANLAFGGFNFNTANVFDSMTFIASTGNFTGKVRVYGYGQ